MSLARRVAAACGSAVVALGLLLIIGPAPAAVADDCTLKKGADLAGPPWPDTRLGFRDAWSVTRGAGVRVAVLDSGVAMNLPQTSGITYSDVTNIVAPKQPVYDCVNHGTAVTAIIAGQSGDTVFSGVAPQATIIPIKVSQGDQNTDGTSAIVAGIRAAVAAHAQVANISITVPNPRADLAAAVDLAHANNLILVCAGGNDGTGNNLPQYPAAYSTDSAYDNVIAVSAVDQKDASVHFSSSGNYIDVAAPGAQLQGLYSGGGFGILDGTSFAAPYVTGTVALMLAAHPGMTPAQVRGRLEATADTPPAAVPDPQYGYGIVNPYLAVTSVGAPAPPVRRSTAAAALPPIPPPAAPDRHLQHLALAIGGGLVGLLLVVAAAAGVLRSSRRRT